MTSSFRVHIPAIAPVGNAQPYATSPTQSQSYYNSQSSIGPPLRPIPPFEIFAHEQQNHQEAEIPIATLQSTWSGMSPEQQAPYHRIYEERMGRFAAESEEYKRAKKDGGFKANAQDSIKQEA